MSAGGGAAGRFWAEFRALYEAAGVPTLAYLVSQGKRQLPPATVSDATLSEWLTGESVPSRRNSRVFLALVAVLQARAKTKDTYEPHPEGWWLRLLAQAQDERSMAQKAGRPRRPDGPELTPVGRGQKIPQSLSRSVYLEQVRRIAPPHLQDRETELTELARYCLDTDGGSYAWWRAGPWAGKSALLSTFVLHPSAELAERVWIVSFFITARLAASDTREAFTDVLLEQLAVLLGQSLPTVLPEATREAYMLSLLSQAAATCQDEGRRLVLVVDGLDEDRGVTIGPDAHSIAGLLPSDPPAGMRVIVASRPDPPVPDDVPDWHPLRDPAIIRPLLASPHARDVQRLGRQELQRLLRGSKAEQDVLGLLTAARGGLSAWDLAELAGVPRWEVEEIVRTAAGRTLQGRLSLLNPRTRPAVYLLGHEELQAAARDYLGDRLVGYYERLHAWAARYRAGGWPPETPEYLLAGYFKLLEDLGDLPRMTELAVDIDRHDRMLDLSGGDAVTLSETLTTLDRIAVQNDPDLASALALACHRDHLADRNAHIPDNLPAVRAALGQLPRAEALARSITHPVSRASALAEVAAALAQAGQYQQAEAIARSITQPESQARALAEVAGALAKAGQHEQAEVIAAQAEAVARSIIGSVWQARALAEVAGALARAGQYQQAEAITGSISYGDSRARALAEVAAALAQAGQYQRAEAIAAQAEAVARSITQPEYQARVLAEVAGALAKAGQHEQAEAIAAQAEAVARSVSHADSQASALVKVAETLAWAGQYQQAEAVARSISGRGGQAHALARVAEALAQAGRHEQAEAIAARAGSLAHSITDPVRQAAVLADVAGALAKAGRYDKAEAIASGIGSSVWQGNALAKMATALNHAGRHERAEAVAMKADAIARSINAPFWQARALTQVAEALAHAGRNGQAEAIAVQAEAIARSIRNPVPQASVMADVVRALAQGGQYDHAQTVARSISNPIWQARALMEVAEALTQVGRHEQADATAAGAGSIARSIRDPVWQARVLVELAGRLIQARQHEQAEAIAAQAESAAGLIGDVDSQAGVLAQVAEVLAKADRAKTSSRAAVAACALGKWTIAARPVLLLMPSAFPMLARTLRGNSYAQASSLADPPIPGN